MRFSIAVPALFLRLFATGAALAEPTPNEPTPDPNSTRTAENAVYVEGGGPSVFFAAGFDRRFHDFAGRLGLGYLYWSSSTGTPAARSTSLLSLPVTISYLGVGSQMHMLELGLGATLFVKKNTRASVTVAQGSTSHVGVFPSAFIGYRRQPPNGGFVLRIGISLLVITTQVSETYFPSPVVPLPYVALGAAFD